MPWQRLRTLILLVVITAVLSLLWVRQSLAGDFTVSASTPAARTLDAPVDAAISIQFSQPVSRSTVLSDTLRVFGRWSGPAPGAIGYSNMDATVHFTPTASFAAGEQVTVMLAEEITSVSGVPLASGYAFQFWIRAAEAGLDFATIDVLQVRDSSGAHTQSYGGVGTDFNNDGWLDISIVNEVSADLRVFLNKAEGTGLYDPFLEPPTAIGSFASPSEPADFNLDGNADLAVANILDSTVSILLGNGDGTFAPQQVIGVGDEPRGLTILDADSDGDPDIVTSNYAAGNLSLIFNLGDGNFSSATSFDSGGTNERSLAAADMNEDGIMDLVVGTGSNQVVVTLGNGDGTFTFASSQSSGGFVWMLNTGDVNGDGHDDVITANSTANTGSILLGDGNGFLGPPTTSPTDPFPLATDVGDIDGDGDLDWVTSSYNGDWLLFLNDGDGNFSQRARFPATSAASCALMMDTDNNGTLDLSLIDEVADEVILVQNLPPPPPTAEIEVSPQAVTATLLAGTAVTHTLTISNSGGIDLTWEVHESSCQTPADVTWLQVQPISGTTATNASSPVAVAFAASEVEPGSYQANLCIASNDPTAAATTISVQMSVVQVEIKRFLPLVVTP